MAKLIINVKSNAALRGLQNEVIALLDSLLVDFVMNNFDDSQIDDEEALDALRVDRARLTLEFNEETTPPSGV